MKFLSFILFILILIFEVRRTTRVYVEENYINKTSIAIIIVMALAIGINLFFILESVL